MGQTDKREADKTMIVKKRSKMNLRRVVFGCFFAVMGILAGLTGVISSNAQVNAVEGETVVDVTEPTTVTTPGSSGEDDTNAEVTEPTRVTPVETTAEETTEDADGDTIETVTVSEPEETEERNKNGKDGCRESLGAIGWLVCPATGKIAEAVDWLYDKIEDILVIDPISAEDETPVYEIWKYCRGVTNIVFIIFLLVVIYSQLTGLGVSNYGIKRALPKLIVAAVLVNLSFLICQLAVDASNIIGNSLRGLFTAVQESSLSSVDVSNATAAQMYGAIAGGGAIAVGAGAIAFEAGAVWMLIPTVLGAVVAVAVGLITIALRQAVVMLLIMISPLAMVAYMLPNTEQWFKKWKDLLMKMLVFYPMFSLLFGASSLAGFAIIASAKSGFGLLLGIAVQIFPLFFAWKMMQMSGTILGTVSSKLQGLASRPMGAVGTWAGSRQQATKAKHLASTNKYRPSLRLMQYMSDRKVAREAELKENEEFARNRGLAYRVGRSYDKNGVPTREAERDYERQAKNMEYTRAVTRHENNMNMGLGQLVAAQNVSASKKARLDKLDLANVTASDMLKVEKARGEKIEYDNAAGFQRRMNDAINVHMDDINGYETNKDTGKLERRKDYKFHFDGDVAKAKEARERYASVSDIMEGDVVGAQYAAAVAAQNYDTQKKIVETKMQKYFDLTPPTKDVEYRLGELTKAKGAADNMDLIIPGLRILNQRGDTDLVKEHVDNVLDKKIGGGMQLGTHASQSLASFLMFEVKDNDPFLRRFGKYINLETANAFNQNNRKVLDFSYDEYIKGYHDGEIDLTSENNPTGRMYARKAMKQLVGGTSLDNIERTALSNLDDSLKRAYGYDKNDKNKAWDVDGWLKKRSEIQEAFEPAFLSASLKWLSGSEQINSGVKFWTGYEQKQKKRKVGDEEVVVTDSDGNPVYEWKPVWEGKEFDGHRDKVAKFFRDKSYAYVKDQTTGQILGMRTDYREPMVEHLLEMYLDDSSEDETSDERRRKYAEEMAEIQTRYGDMDANEAKTKREKDVTDLKRNIAGKQLRKILDESGKLEQIYTTRRSGAANNAKDWLRKMLNLDNKEEIYKYLDSKDVALKKKKKNQAKNQQQDSDGGAGGSGSPYNDASFRVGVMSELNKIFEESGDQSNPDESFYKRSMDKVKREFGEDSEVAGRYADYKKNNPNAERGELWEALEEILGNFFADNMDE